MDQTLEKFSTCLSRRSNILHLCGERKKHIYTVFPDTIALKKTSS